jgi:phytoene desaturase
VNERFDVVVVGAGVGGLAAAITLGAAGRRVLVVEAHDAAGGKAATVELDGVEVDTGPSVLTMPDVFQSLLARAGLDPAREVRLRSVDPAFDYLYPDGVKLSVYHRLPETLRSVERTLGHAAAVELEAFMRYAAEIWSAAAPVFVYGPAPTVRNILGHGWSALGAMARIDALRSMQSAIEERVRSPHLRTLLLRYATYNGSDARRAPATLNCISHVELELGGYGVEGGMAELVRALVRACAAVGVSFRYGCPVEQVRLTSGRVSGVRVAAETFDAPQVVINADVAHLAQALLPPGTDHGLPRGAEPSMSGYTAIYRARREPSRAPHTVVFPSDYPAEFADIFDRGRPPNEPTVYVCAQERCHGRRGWLEHEPLFVMANAPAEPPEGDSPPDRFDVLRETVRRRLTEVGVIEPSAERLWDRTPTGLATRFAGTRGSIYGAASNGMLSAFQRPDNRVRRVPGLYLASGSAHPGGGLPLAALSGLRAAESALAECEASAA